MNNNIYQKAPEYKQGANTDQLTIGGIHKTSKIIASQKALAAIEDEFMKISFKSNRSEAQRENRRKNRQFIIAPVILLTLLGNVVTAQTNYPPGQNYYQYQYNTPANNYNTYQYSNGYYQQQQITNIYIEPAVIVLPPVNYNYIPIQPYNYPQQQQPFDNSGYNHKQ